VKKLIGVFRCSGGNGAGAGCGAIKMFMFGDLEVVIELMKKFDGYIVVPRRQ
jgi:hypothetical protein